jgi:hypothetical protein
MGMLIAVVLLSASCAAPFADLAQEQREDLCGFLRQRANQGDMLVCVLGASKVAARDPRFGEKIAPAFTVRAKLLYRDDGSVSAVRDLDVTLPKKGRRGAARCFRSSLLGFTVPAPGKQIAVPLTLLVRPAGAGAGAGADPQERGGEAGPGCSVLVNPGE